MQNGSRFELCNISTLSCLLIGAGLTFAEHWGLRLTVEAFVCATTYAQAQKLEDETLIMHKICPERWFVSYSVDIPPSSPSLKRTRERKRNFLRGQYCSPEPLDLIKPMATHRCGERQNDGRGWLCSLFDEEREEVVAPAACILCWKNSCLAD